MTQEALSLQELNTLSYLRKWFETNPKSPSYQEIGAAIGVRHPHARRIVLGLAGKGKVTVTPNKHRTIRLADRPSEQPSEAAPSTLMPPV